MSSEQPRRNVKDGDFGRPFMLPNPDGSWSLLGTLGDVVEQADAPHKFELTIDDSGPRPAGRGRVAKAITPVGAKLEIPRVARPDTAIGDVEWVIFEDCCWLATCVQITDDLVVLECIGDEP